MEQVVAGGHHVVTVRHHNLRHANHAVDGSKGCCTVSVTTKPHPHAHAHPHARNQTERTQRACTMHGMLRSKDPLVGGCTRHVLPASACGAVPAPRSGRVVACAWGPAVFGVVPAAPPSTSSSVSGSTRTGAKAPLCNWSTRRRAKAVATHRRTAATADCRREAPPRGLPTTTVFNSTQLHSTRHDQRQGYEHVCDRGLPLALSPVHKTPCPAPWDALRCDGGRRPGTVCPSGGIVFHTPWSRHAHRPEVVVLFRQESRGNEEPRPEPTLCVEHSQLQTHPGHLHGVATTLQKHSMTCLAPHIRSFQRHDALRDMDGGSVACRRTKMNAKRNWGALGSRRLRKW